MSDFVSETDKMLKDYKAVNRMQNEKIELLSKELCEKNNLIEKLLEENRRLKEKQEGAFSFMRKLNNLFKN